MKIRNVLSTIILILVLTLTVGFSAFVSEMSISNLVANVRVEKDVRITGFSIDGGSMSGGLGELNWDADSIMLGDSINGKGDNISLEVTITNIGSAEVGIYDIVVPEGIDFEITNYNMKSKLCDSSGKCNLGISKTIRLNVSNSSYSDVENGVKIDFDFREFHTIIYENITNNGYPTEMIAGDNLNVTFTGEVPSYITVYSNGVVVDSSLYTYSNGSLVYTNVSSNITIEGPKTLFSAMKNGAVSDSDVNFSSSTGLSTLTNTAYVRNGTENNIYPIYYYRGNVTNNNVKFANFCWKMVRTTETGGVKLIYNGVPAEDGSCNNTGTASQLVSTSKFSSYNSPAYVGYMYGTVYTAVSKDLSSQAETYVYGNDVNWDGTSYTLADTTTSSSWSTDYKTLATKYHYTCFNTTGACTDVYYINYFGSSSSAYYLTLKDGKDIEDAKEEMFVNTTDSKIKTVIDSWYASNMTGYTNMLEDTVWCNDRTITSGPLYSKDANSTGSSYFGAYLRNVSSIGPSLTCPEKLDSFTVSSSKGNGSLIYPVGLLTADEYTLAGSGNKGYSTTSYLHTGQYQWSLSPYNFSSNVALGFSLYSSGALNFDYVNGTRGVRPSVSLKLGTLISGGDGSVSTPYIVE